ncbi:MULTISPECIES: hypothetical protein [unclassified Arthrobacter]|uniref:hypothetical protein n=1 Tax=unclassified Arthrobacter TaxID=235627 RepID=UPI00159DB01A|nr:MULTISPECIES: hypothetical protein [unclassified Arthrobacter]MCQ9164469.1 hypothetical protein [Arthrobacter sp. STN4]NVN00459.1 hypothetical protein [Arthrobacter sp. SDTb3-6]
MTITSVNRTHRTSRTQPATGAQAAARRRPEGIPVLPAVDTNLGSVTFFTPGGHRQYWSAEPAELLDALARAVRPAQWIPEIGTLVVTVAQTGVRSGHRIGFRLAVQ